MQSIRQLIQNLKGLDTELGEKRNELLHKKRRRKRHFFPIC